MPALPLIETSQLICYAIKLTLNKANSRYIMKRSNSRCEVFKCINENFFKVWPIKWLKFVLAIIFTICNIMTFTNWFITLKQESLLCLSLFEAIAFPLNSFSSCKSVRLEKLVPLLCIFYSATKWNLFVGLFKFFLHTLLHFMCSQ